MCKKLGEFLDRIGQMRGLSKIFDRLAERRRWRIIFVHEAGHAVAWAALFKQYKDITAQDCDDDNDIRARDRKASCGQAITSLDFAAAPLNGTILIAAGAQAEQLCFGDKSEGFIGDRNHLVRLLLPLPPAPQIDSDIVYTEVESDYPQTKAFVRRYEAALRAIGKAALKEFERAGLLGQTFKKRPILSAAKVEEIFNAHPPTD